MTDNTRPDVPSWHPDADVKVFKAGDDFYHLAPTRAARDEDVRTAVETEWQWAMQSQTRCGKTTIDRRLWDDTWRDLIPPELCPDCKAAAEAES